MHVLAASPTMPGFLNALSGPLNHFGYLAVFFLVLVEDFGIPVPGETILIAAAIYAGHQQLNVVAVGLVGFTAAVIGDNIGFAIGHFGGRTLALRWGKYVFLTEERLVQSEKFFEHHGGKVIVAARFIEGLRQANGIIAGIGGMHWRRFVIFNALGAALWVGTWVSLGYLAGNHIDTIYHYITQYSLYVLIAVVVVIAALIIRHLVRRRRRAGRREAGAQEALAVPAHADAAEHQETAEPAGAPDHAKAPDHAETPVQAGIQDHAGAPEHAAKPDSGEAPDSAAASDSSVAPDSAETQDPAETQNGTKTQNGVPSEDSANTQSS